MNRPDKAEELFRKGYNCSQSVFAAFADVLDMTVEEAAKIATVRDAVEYITEAL